MMQFNAPAELELRDYQADAIEALRSNIRAGIKRQILCAGTGSGKTVIATKLMKSACDKGSYSLFMVDRVPLVNQTSATFDKYGLPHGVIMSQHPRWQPRENVQVCSIQTLANRQLPREPDLFIYDECHAQYKTTLDLMDQYPNAIKIGLTATPFTAGMGKHWDAMINVRSTRDLINDGFLIEPEIYLAKSPSDTEIRLMSSGEMDQESASEAGIKIIGDVVSMWIEKTNEIFGGPVKTIVFSPSVDHGREICAAFAAAGFNFQQVSYLDKDADARAAKIAEFSEKDSLIDGLVSCAALTKGFDCPEIRCIASGQMVLTDKGLVPIESVTADHMVWDGVEFVSHKGVVFKGYQNVIEYAGLVATPDHEVHTAQGWRAFGDCAAKQIPITQTGLDGRAIRCSEGRFAGCGLGESREVGQGAHPVGVHEVWHADAEAVVGHQGCATSSWLPGLLHGSLGAEEFCRSRVVGPKGEGHDDEMRTGRSQILSKLRRAWDRVSFFFSKVLRGMDRGEHWAAEARQEHPTRSHRQQRALRAWKYSMGVKVDELQQYPSGRMGGNDAQIQNGTSRNTLCGQDASQSICERHDVLGCNREVQTSIGQAKRAVWDILQAGPRKRFTCEGLLVHNCGISCRPYRKSLSSHMQEIGRVMRSSPGKDRAIWIDHSGNMERFALDMLDVWNNGAGDLSHASKQDKAPRERNTEAAKEKFCCKECGGAMRGNLCMACGWERPARSGVEVVDGVLVKFDASAIGLAARDGLRAECVKDPRDVWSAALSYCLDRKPRDEAKARRWAYGVWCGVYPGAKLPRGWFDASRHTFTPGAWALVDREVKRFRKSAGPR